MINLFEIKGWYKLEISYEDLCKSLFQKDVIQIDSSGVLHKMTLHVKTYGYFDDLIKLQELSDYVYKWYGYSLETKYK